MVVYVCNMILVLIPKINNLVRVAKVLFFWPPVKKINSLWKYKQSRPIKANEFYLKVLLRIV